MYSAHELNKQSDNIPPWHTSFPIWDCPLFYVQFYLLLLDQHTDFSGGRSGGLVLHLLKNFPELVVVHTVKVFSVVNEAEVNAFLEFSCCFYDPVDVGNLISGFLPFLNSVWTSGSSRFTYVEPILENFEHYFASMWDQCNCAVVSIFFGIAFLWHWNENGTFSSPVATAEFSKFAGILSELLS